MNMTKETIQSMHIVVILPFSNKMVYADVHQNL
jgi:hypothetical protein